MNSAGDWPEETRPSLARDLLEGCGIVLYLLLTLVSCVIVTPIWAVAMSFRKACVWLKKGKSSESGT